MSRVERIEEEVKALSRDELARFTQWFAEWRAAEWDRQIAEDASAGRLDGLLREVETERASGRLTPL